MKLRTFAMTIGLALVAAGPAAATYPGDNGLISWSTSQGYDDGSLAIWGKHAFGGELRRLTFHKDSAGGAAKYRSDTHASWAGDGRSFVFARDDGVRSKLFLKRLGEGRPTRIPLGDMVAEQPALAPDGRRVAFVQVGPSEDPLGRGPLTVGVADVDGTDFLSLSAGDNPTWTPDGQRIVFESTRGGRTRLVSIRPDGTHKHVFPKRCAGVGDPSFAPDGSQMAAVYSATEGGPTRIWTMGLGCKNKRQITFHRVTLAPAWSPDGRWIAYFAPPKAERPGGTFVVGVGGAGIQLVDRSGGFDLDWQPRP